MCGLGMGMTGAILIFLFLQYHLSTDRHQPNFDRLYRLVLNLHLEEGTEYSSDSSIPLARALSMDYSQIEKVGFIKKIPNTAIASYVGKQVRRFIEKGGVAFADQGFIDMFSFQMLEGEKANLFNEPHVVLISEKVANKYFGTTDVVGKLLQLDNATELKIVGVMKDQLNPTDLKSDIYISLPTLKTIYPTYEFDNFGWLNSNNKIFVLLKEETLSQSVEKLFKSNGPKYYGSISKSYEHKLQPLSDVHFDERYGGEISRSILSILAAVGFFLMIIAAINFVNMATAQALKRAKEIGVRKVLGGTQRQLFWQFMSETALVTIGSALLAIVLVALLLPALNNWIHTQVFYFDMLFQWQLLIFWLLTILVIILIAGFYPSVVISGFNPIVALKTKLGTQAVGGIGLRRSLITFQLIIAQVLVIGTIVLVLQLRFFKNADLGFDKSSIITVQLPKKELDQSEQGTLRNRLLQLSDIKSVTYQYEAPLSSMGHGGSVKFDNRSEWEKFVIRERYGDENYLATYKMRLIAGRSYMDRDSVTEFVINVELMQRLGIIDPQLILGKTLITGMKDRRGRIVGVINSFHLKSLQVSVEPCAIFAKPEQYKEIAIQVNTQNWSRSIQSIQSVWQKTYPDEVFTYQFVNEQIAKFYEKEEQLMTLIRSFAMVAVIICCLGLYGMVSFMVVQRIKEIGIRKVLGAGIESIVMLFGREFLTLVIIAFFIASPLAWYVMTNWLNGFAYRIDLHWWILGSGGILIFLLTLCTVGYQVVKAAMVDPVKSLRTE